MEVVLMSALDQEKCVPCHKGSPAVTPVEKKMWLKDLPHWSVKKIAGVPTLIRSFEFPDFKTALRFGNRVAAAAERQDHHPALLLEYGKATVSWNTHAIKDLHRNDFVMAAKTSRLYKRRE
jgi:4a-hydroxytetrahydrobiopterin dehydratase